MTAALVLLAAALVVWPAPHRNLYRVIGVPAPDRSPRWLGRAKPSDDPFAIAAGYDLFSVCLRAGQPVSDAAAVTAAHCPPILAGPLGRAAELLALGADPVTAWTVDEAAGDCFAELASLARRASRSGSSLADGVTALADTTREHAQAEALARAERAGVTISGPLGLCFLPAFVCLGIAPVVVGLASGMLGGI
ncbi:MAG: type II secretion system F family protein [Gordonia sp. (in: high G+C Gram-positive bacteria)]|uniref:type II secretion system F family protein n=1 Tax=Gordonia sp. (in: high G+C Gram-positive bacteria) TaxID=84139 RepID=UPI0039E2C9FD